MRALSGLTPALSRRLQRQLLAHLPPAAARSLRRTLSLHTPAPHTAPAARSLSADHHAPDDRQPHADAPATSTPSPEKSPESPDITSPHYSTLPRLRRRSNSREVTSPVLSTVDTETTSISREPAVAFACERASDRPLLSKYLTPERTLSLEESYGSDGGSAKSEPTPLGANSLATRRYSLRAPATDQQRRRVSRFLRSDFFDTPPDENLYERQRKERELETQKILREIREKKNKSQEAATARSPTDVVEAPLAYRDDITTPKKSLSPICFLAGKERSRSNTPFFPILDNIKETTVDTALSAAALRRNTDEKMRLKSIIDENSPKESKLVRPKSYPVKTLDSIEEPSENILHNTSLNIDVENSERSLPRESKLLRPKSYPTSSPSPEKVFINRAAKKEAVNNTTKDAVSKNETNNDVEVSFSITLPKKTKADTLAKTEPVKDTQTSEKHSESKSSINKKSSESDNLVLKKYQLIKNKEIESSEMTEVKPEKVTAIPNGGPHDESTKVACNEDSKIKPQLTKKDATTSQAGETNQIEKKGGTGKKKIIRKVASKYKSDIDSNQDTNDTKTNTEKKKVVKKVKEKVEKEKLGDDDGSKPTSVPKKKSMLQSIGQKLEKFASAKSSSPEKSTENNATKKNGSKLNRMQREQSVPVNIEPITESNLIKRAVTLTDVAALEDQTTQPSKTTVSKVLGLFKKFEPKEKSKAIVEKCVSENIEDNKEDRCKTEPKPELGSENSEKDKPRRPTSLLLNGLGCKSKFDTASNDGVPVLSIDNDDILVSKRDNESKNIRNSLKLDFSRLPRVKKIVPTNPVIEPQIMNVSSFDNETEKKEYPEKYSVSLYNCTNADNVDTQSRSRSRSRSTISNSEIKSDISADVKFADKNALTSDNNTLQPKNHDITPEKEDIVDRIRRKSFYSRFNEKKQRRKSSLVGPGAIEYDPVARIHSQPTETKYEVSPTSPLTFDLSPLSPGPSVSSDLSPSTERYRSFLSEMPVSTRGNLRFENYGLNDKIDTYRSLDRNDFRKYPGSRSYLDYDPPTYGTSRYSRTKSLLENADTTGDNNVLSNPLRDTHKYNRTLSMYSPGSYATYRPKRTTRNSAIILKESEKEPSPENILDKIRQKKITISVTRKPETEKESLPRSNISSKGEGDGAECSEKVD